MEPLAKLVYRDDHQIIVACPYCMSTHRHGDGGMTDVSGNSYSSHCHNGSYRVFGTFDFRTAMIALRRREADLKRKRAAKKTECGACNSTGRLYVGEGSYADCHLCEKARSKAIQAAAVAASAQP